MSQKPSEADNEDKSKKSNANNTTNIPNVPPQFLPMNMFVPPPGYPMAPPGYPYYPTTPWYIIMSDKV